MECFSNTTSALASLLPCKVPNLRDVNVPRNELSTSDVASSGAAQYVDLDSKLLAKVINVGSDTFGKPNFSKGLT